MGQQPTKKITSCKHSSAQLELKKALQKNKLHNNHSLVYVYCRPRAGGVGERGQSAWACQINGTGWKIRFYCFSGQRLYSLPHKVISFPTKVMFRQKPNRVSFRIRFHWFLVDHFPNPIYF